MDEKRLREIEARCKAATEGPWKLWGGWGPVGTTEYMAVQRMGPESDEYAGLVANAHYPPKSDFYGKREDLEFCAYARTDIPDLLAEVWELREAVGRHEYLSELQEAEIASLRSRIATLEHALEPVEHDL